MQASMDLSSPSSALTPVVAAAAAASSSSSPSPNPSQGAGSPTFFSKKRKSSSPQSEVDRGAATQITRNFQGKYKDNYRSFQEFIQSGSSKFIQLLKPVMTSRSHQTYNPFHQYALKTLGEHVNLNPEAPHYVNYQGAGERPTAQVARGLFASFFAAANHFASVVGLQHQKLAFQQQTLQGFQNQLAFLNSYAALLTTAKHNFTLLNNLKSFGEDHTNAKFQQQLGTIKTALISLATHLDHLCSHATAASKELPEHQAALQLRQEIEELTKAQETPYKDYFARLETFCSSVKKQLHPIPPSISKLNGKILKLSQTQLAPLCLSLAYYTTSKGDGCWISLSNPEQYSELFQQLKTFLAHYPSEKCDLILLNPASEDSQTNLQLVANLLEGPQSPRPYRGCAEKSVSSMALKQAFEGDFQLIDIMNLSFYPFNAQEKAALAIPETTSFLPLTIQENSFWLKEIPCCKSCHANKFAVIALLGAANDYREYLEMEQLASEFLLREIQQEARILAGDEASSSPNLVPPEPPTKKWITSPPKDSIAIQVARMYRPKPTAGVQLFANMSDDDEEQKEQPAAAPSLTGK